jgi:cytochrome P450
MDRTLGSEYLPAQRIFAAGDGPLDSFFERIVLYRDPPAHDVLRAFLHHVVRARFDVVVQRLPALVEELLAPALDGRAFDVVEDLAMPLAVRVLLELFGVTDAPGADLRANAVYLAAAFGTRLEESERARANAGVSWLREFSRSVLARWGQPGDGIPMETLVDNVAFLIFAGFETTGNAIANALAALLEHPQELQRLHTTPGYVRSAAEEVLRYDPPIQGVARAVREPVSIGERVIRPGRVLILLIGSANRDERAFPDADRLDVSRDPNRHVSFGGGIHHCLGAPLARREIAAVLQRFVDLTTSVDIAGSALRRTDSRLRGYTRLPIIVRPR